MLNDKKMQEQIRKERIASHTAMCHAVADTGVLARIVKTVAPEYVNLSVEDIRDNYLLESTLTVMAQLGGDLHDVAFQAVHPENQYDVVDFCIHLDVHGGYDPDLYVEETGEHDPEWVGRNLNGLWQRAKNLPKTRQRYGLTVIVDKNGMAGKDGCIHSYKVAKVVDLMDNKQVEPDEDTRSTTPVIVMLPDGTESKFEVIRILQALCIPDEPLAVAAVLEACGIQLGLETEGWILNMYRHLKTLNGCYLEMTHRRANLTIACDLLAHGRTVEKICENIVLDEDFVRAVNAAAKGDYSMDEENLNRIYAAMAWDWGKDSYK